MYIGRMALNELSVIVVRIIILVPNKHHSMAVIHHMFVNKACFMHRKIVYIEKQQAPVNARGGIIKW